MERQLNKNWRYFDQHTVKTIFVNNEQNNDIDITRTRATIKIPFIEYFGEISKVTINDEIIESSCNFGCTLKVPPFSELTIELENIWGGKAFAQVSQIETN